MSDENGDVTDEGDAGFLGLGCELTPSGHEALLLSLVCLRRFTVWFQRLGMAISQRQGPCEPWLMAMVFFDRSVEGPIIQPRLIFFHVLRLITLHEFGPCGKRRGGGVGGAVLVGRREWEHLPRGVAAPLKPLQKAKGAVEGDLRKRGQVAQHTFPLHGC